MDPQKARLLIVDDDDDLRATLPMIFNASGYSTRSASDGRTALVEIHTEVPDILISDLNMPGMSGFELLAVVRHRFPSIGVIAMSSAFSGSTIPDGVVADVFYEKATGLAALLLMVKNMDSPHSDLLRPRPVLHNANSVPQRRKPPTSPPAISSS